MIISASRRTDIPALYSEWFLNRVRAGWCLVPNPFNSRQVSRVSLKPENVDAVIFWSKNPAPMMPHLDELDARGLRYCFLFTLNDYPPELEPNVPPLRNRMEVFTQLAKRLGPLRVIWRYDPIIISNRTSVQSHLEKFAMLVQSLEGSTSRVIVSILDWYQKTDRRLMDLEKEGYAFDREALQRPSTGSLLSDMGRMAKEAGMEIYTCAEPTDFSQFGVPPGRCIDDALLRRIWPSIASFVKDPSQRKDCLCVSSKDIGMNDTCVHGCAYCYSTRNLQVAVRRHKEHDPASPALWGHPNPPGQQSTSRRQRTLFDWKSADP